MINAFANFIANECSTTANTRILVALSGGPDSVCLLHLLKSGGFNIEAAHCNFQLRDKESDDDENFVVSLCNDWNIPLSVNRFNTIKYAAVHKISIEMAARNLRYEWFESLRKQKALDYIAVAHNANDSAETFFLNLSRGTGLAGLTGIKPVNEYIIRPILFANRNQILNYLIDNNINSRHDSSNDSHDITRNYIRHRILPLFGHLNPSFIASLTDTMQLLKAANKMNENRIEADLAKLMHQSQNFTFLSTNAFHNPDEALLYIFYATKKYGFNSTQVRQIANSLSNAGKVFTSVTHQLLIDRNQLIIRNKTKKPIFEMLIHNDGEFGFDGGKISLQKIPCCPPYPANPYEVSLDASKLVFPLTLRLWQKGDKMVPLGMKGFKKISDMLVDAKIDLFTKDSCLVLVNQNAEIIWLVGIRLDNRYRIAEGCTQVMRITYKEE